MTSPKLITRGCHRNRGDVTVNACEDLPISQTILTSSGRGSPLSAIRTLSPTNLRIVERVFAPSWTAGGVEPYGTIAPHDALANPSSAAPDDVRIVPTKRKSVFVRWDIVHSGDDDGDPTRLHARHSNTAIAA